MNSSVERFKWNTSDQRGSGSLFVKEDSSSKLNSEDESDLGDAVLCKSSITETSFHFEGVRFTPKVIEFIDAFEGKQFSVNVVIQNVGKKPVLVKIGEPNSFIFQLKKPSRRVRLLACGSFLTKTITYSHHNDDIVQKSQIPIQINGRFVDYPIVVKRAAPEITVEPNQLDFRKINLGATAKTLTLTIRNSGGKRTKFEIDLGKNDLDLVVTPIRGTIKAKSKVAVIVEMMGMNEGEYFKELWVTTSEMCTRVPVIVEVVRPRLEIIHQNVTEDFVLIDFQPTFVNTQRAESFLLKNYSADTTLFIALAEIGGDLQFLKDARKRHETCKLFMFTAEEGRLEPFESRVLTALFQPKISVAKKGWSRIESLNKKKTESRLEHIVFIRLSRVHCIEIKELAKVETRPVLNTVRERSDTIMNSRISLQTPIAGPHKNPRTTRYMSEMFEYNSRMKKNSGFLMTSSLDEKVLRLCLHGTSVEPNVVVQPTSFEFEPIDIGQTKQKVLTLKNDSILPIKYNFSKVVNVMVVPNEGWLTPGQSSEFLITVTPTCGGIFQTNIQIEILAKSDVIFENDKDLVTITKLQVPMHYVANIPPSDIKPKIGFGITPLLNDEVGFLKTKATFGGEYQKPRAAMLGTLTKSMKPEWMKKEPDQIGKVGNAMIAFPNDRPRNFYHWDKEDICRTIFKGFFRYSPPEDETYTLTLEQKKLKKRHYLLWKDYLAILRNIYNPQSKQARDESCGGAYKFTDYKKLSLIDKAAGQYNKPTVMKMDHLKHLVPLSPQHLNNINVEPKLINFGTVALNDLVHETLTVYNMNPFPIGIRFVPGKSAVKVLEGDTIIVLPFITKTLSISFETQDLGRHYGFLNYVINGSHQFKITISAFITSKTLVMEDKNMVIQFGTCPVEFAFQPRSTFLELGNLLQSSINYYWQLPADSAFIPDNMNGAVPPRTQLLTEIKLDMQPDKSFYSELNLISESGNSELIKLIYPNRNVSVFFLTNRIEMNDIPLNLPTKVTPIIQNACYHGVVFEVLNWTPIPGVVVQPKQGVLKPRSFLPLEINIQIPVIMKFSFDVVVLIHQTQKIIVKISGNVVVPMIRIKPTDVVMRKICSQSFDTVTLCIENAGTTPAEIDIDFNGCPEYKVVDEKSQVFLPPLTHAKVKIRFQPKDVARYVFYLPIIVNRILGPPMMQEPDTEYLGFYISTFEKQYEGHGKVYRSENSKVKLPCVCINSTVTPSLLNISRLNINFRPAINPDSKVQCQAIVISNDFTDNVTFCIRNDDLGEVNDSPFDLKPVDSSAVQFRSKALKAQLKQGEKLVLNAIFSPKKPGIYEVEVPIFIRGYSNGVVYNYLNFRGELKQPRLYADAKEIHFPPLPLNIGCDVVVTIVAENYNTQDTISCLIWSPPNGGDLVSEYLSITWLNEPRISALKEPEVFQARVNFSSPFPIGLRNYLIFIDSEGHYCSVLVTAVADNSSVTTHAFLAIRASNYKLVRDVPTTNAANLYNANKADVKSSKIIKNVNIRKIHNIRKETSRTNGASNACSLPIDKGSKLIIQVSKSMSRPTQLSLVSPTKNSSFNPKNIFKPKECSSTVLIPAKSRLQNSVSQSDSYGTSQSADPPCKETEVENETTYPHFPTEETAYGKHLQDTLAYVERWLFEVVMKCDQYFEIPKSLQKLRSHEKFDKNGDKHNKSRSSSNKSKVENRKAEKDFLDILEEIVPPDMKGKLPQRNSLEKHNRVENLYIFYAACLQWLRVLGCQFPHVKPEYLLNYEDYSALMSKNDTPDIFEWDRVDCGKISFVKTSKDKMNQSNPKVNIDGSVSSTSIFHRGQSWRKSLFDDFKAESEDNMKDEEEEEEKFEDVERTEMRWHLVEGRQFIHETEPLNKKALEARSTQAWLDVMIQIFRVLFLGKIYYAPGLPKIDMVGLGEQISVDVVDVKATGQKSSCDKDVSSSALENNLYSIEERILLMWLNELYAEERDTIWRHINNDGAALGPRVINNFDKDLSDSLVLIVVTATYCPYMVSQYFSDVFLKPDTQSKVYHNAGKLTLVWKILNIGLTVESTDIINANPVFMIMIVTQLYKVLPTLHPNLRIYFATSLSTESMRTISIKNENQENVFYQVKFMGEHEGLFRLKTSAPMVVVKPMSTTEIHVIFTARRIKKVTAILILCGYVISPNFAQHLCFYLEGEPSSLRECTKLSFTTPLYKVLCTKIPVTPPYSEPTTYDVWYTTTQPQYKESTDVSMYIKPWSKIWSRKVARRLFLNKCEVTIEEGKKSTALEVAVACLTEEERNFWLLFRSSSIGDFIILVNIKANVKVPLLSFTAFFSPVWSKSAECLCSTNGKTLNLKGTNCRKCPFLIEVSIPMRNDPLWDAIKNMFLRTLHAQEKSFWSKHFEKNIGLCLILWFISMEEEDDVADEFIHILQTRIVYHVKVEPPNNKYLTVPEKIEISDIRSNLDIRLPIHLSKNAPEKLKVNLTMTSENEKEVRRYKLTLSPDPRQTEVMKPDRNSAIE